MKFRQLTYLFGLACFIVMVFGYMQPAQALFQDISAQNDALAGQEGAGFTVTDDPRLVAARGIQITVSLLGFGFFFYTLYGGVIYATSQGKEDEIARAKSTILTGVIGITIVLAAYSITQLVSDTIMKGLGQDECSQTDGPCFYAVPDATTNNDPLSPQRDNGSTAEGFWRSVF